MSGEEEKKKQLNDFFKDAPAPDFNEMINEQKDSEKNTFEVLKSTDNSKRSKS